MSASRGSSSRRRSSRREASTGNGAAGSSAATPIPRRRRPAARPSRREDRSFVPLHHVRTLSCLGEHLGADEHFYTLTSEGSWYYFTGRPCPSRFLMPWTAPPPSSRRKSPAISRPTGSSSFSTGATAGPSGSTASPSSTGSRFSTGTSGATTVSTFPSTETNSGSGKTGLPGGCRGIVRMPSIECGMTPVNGRVWKTRQGLRRNRGGMTGEGMSGSFRKAPAGRRPPVRTGCCAPPSPV